MDNDDYPDSQSGEEEVEEQEVEAKPKSVLKKREPKVVEERPVLPEQPDPATVDFSKLTPVSPEIIARQATINIGTIGHVAHGKSTCVKAISGVQVSGSQRGREDGQALMSTDCALQK